MRRSVFAAATGIVVLALAAWLLIAPTALIRYPDDVDQTLTYRGVIAVPDAPGATTATVEQLTITRHLWVASSTFKTANIREDITTRYGTEVLTQHNGYVIDRRTMRTRTNGGNFAFTTDNAVDRKNSYGPTLPMNLDGSGKYRLWSDDTGTAYNVIGDGTTSKVDGVTLDTFTASVAPRPVTAAYQQFLNLPETTTLTTLAKAVHVNLQTVLDTLKPIVSPIVFAELNDATTMPIPLRYSLQSNGEIRVEPNTGAMVDVHNVANRLSVTADLTALSLPTILSPYAQDPVVRTVLAQFDQLAQRPALIAMSMQYGQTPASVRSAVAVARGLRNDAHKVTVDVPLGLAALALLLLVGALLPPRRQAAQLHLVHHHRRDARSAA
jgi:hypothetical protein